MSHVDASSNDLQTSDQVESEQIHSPDEERGNLSQENGELLKRQA